MYKENKIINIFRNMINETNFYSAKCYEFGEEPYEYIIKDKICIESRVRNRRQLKNGLLKNEFTISEGINAFINKFKNDKFDLYKIKIRNKKDILINIEIKYKNKLYACFYISTDLEENYIEFSCDMSEIELFIKKLYAAILLFDL